MIFIKIIKVCYFVIFISFDILKRLYIILLKCKLRLMKYFRRFIVISVLLSLFFGNSDVFAKNKSRKIFYQIERDKDRTNYFLSKEDESIYETIKKHIKNERWFDAYKLEKRISNEGFRNAINTVISLNKFKSMSNMAPSEVIGLIEFNTENYFLSEFELFNNKIEIYYLRNIVKYENVKDYFKKFTTKNIDVIIKLLNDKIDNLKNSKKDGAKINNDVHDIIVKVWLENDFNQNEQMAFLKAFGDRMVDGDIIKKAENYVYNRKIGMLENIIPMIYSRNHRIMFENILEMEKKPKIISHLIKITPKELRNNDSFLFAQARYHRKMGNDDEVLNILFNIKNYQNTELYWWNYKHIYVRELVKQKKYRKAYNLANSYNGYKNVDYTDAEWLAGWISLRYLNDYNTAYKHFENIHKIVSYPISVARSAYWLGRTAVKLNKEKEAVHWYDLSSKYSTTFYGQLSHYAKYSILTKNGEEYKDFELPDIPNITQNDMDNINKNGTVKLALLYYNYDGKREEANIIFKELINKLLKNKGEIAEVIEIVGLLDDERILIPLSKLASYRQVFFIDNLFPILRMVRKNDKNIALIHSIIKQESGFIIQAESSVGAIGFMQIMPATAKSLCNQLHITYNQYKLKHDPQYNIKLGTYYINQLVNQFNGSKILAIASYNAGPKATSRWINDFGDPRDSEDMESVIDWMESITYKETRNYVQRILENLIVYEYRLGLNQ